MVGRKRGFRKSSIRCWQAAVTADFSAAEKPLDLMCPLGSRRFGTTWHGLSPVPGQKLIQLVDGVVVDADKHVGQPGLRIFEICSAEKAVLLTGIDRSGKSVIAKQLHVRF